ncbi:MAG: cell division protein SepF [Synergistaceae bacterium]|nr:cell division protein SepF [Synergistaceae bacterium]MBQ3398184.1 cell division protein SepF [Synergistaceae bacterium]MBQ4402634.1 cell division protein SepF [Synergistaceae bacterium]MBQ6115640.1 cell division protein SepF [Synergistaceae bacterium]MBQ6418276.1 cell division protein SepF [Synergistaceae bacterium]
MNLMKFFGFENDEDDYDDNDDYTEERPRKQSSSRKESTSRSTSGNPAASGKLILFNGVASDSDKRRLREAFNSGAMILIDLHTLNQREFEEDGKDFITFMGGVAFARNGELKFIEPAQYLVTPRADMFEVWPEEVIVQ